MTESQYDHVTDELAAGLANFVVAAAESPASAMAHAIGRVAALPERDELVSRVRAELAEATKEDGPKPSRQLLGQYHGPIHGVGGNRALGDRTGR